MESGLDVENIEKILEAAQQIENMAKTRPEQAAEMLQRARYLVDLAEQIKRDWLNRFANVPPGTVAQALSRVIPARTTEPVAPEQANAELHGVY